MYLADICEQMVLEHFQIATAPFIVIPALSRRNKLSSVSELFATALAKSKHSDSLSKFPLFLKPVGQSTSTGISSGNKVFDVAELHSEFNRLSIHFPTNDILVETFLKGREFTVGVIGTGLEARCIGLTELKYQSDSNQWPDFYASDMKSADVYIGMVPIIPDRNDPQVISTIDVALQAWRALCCRDGGRVDVRLDSGEADAIPHILEVSSWALKRVYYQHQVTNSCLKQLQPLPGLRPGISDLPLLADAAGISYDTLISMIVESAISRIGISKLD